MSLTMTKMQISERSKNIPQAMSIYINQLVYDLQKKGRDIITLSLGEAFFDIPLFDFKKLNYIKGYHYSDSQGILELRKKICEYYYKQYGAQVDSKDEILISAGSKPIIYLSMQATMNAGDEVLIHEPGWLSYQEQAKLLGVVPKFIPYHSPVKDFSSFFSEKTRMVIINNPNNPAGKSYSKEELMSLYNQCRPRGIYLLVDEAYSDFILDDSFCSIAKIAPDKDGIILINSLSKNMGMSGWRVGYVITSPILIKEILKINQHIITCAPTLLLYYMATYFDEVISITLPQVRAVVEKRSKIKKVISNLGLQCLDGEATFYFFLNLEDFPGSDVEFALHLLLFNDIAVVPGSAYGKSTDRFVRLAIGAESEERITQALTQIKTLIGADKINKDLINKKLHEEGFKIIG